MKKTLLVSSVLMALALFSCNKKPTTYLELWSKQVEYNEQGEIAKEEIREYKDKKLSHSVVTDYYDDLDQKRILTDDYTYNSHGDIDTLTERSEIVPLDNNVNDDPILIHYHFTYEYDKNGLMLNKIIQIEHDPNYPSYDPNHFFYEYDDLGRLTHETDYCYTSNGEPILINEYKYTYEGKFDTYKTFELYENKIDRRFLCTHTLDSKGYPIELFVEVLDNEHQVSFTVDYCTYTYDKYHCLIETKEYQTDESGIQNLRRVTNSTYHKNNPNKPKIVKIKTKGGYNPFTLKTYTYDKYNRTTSIETKIGAEGYLKPYDKIIYEYNEVIRG